MHSTFMVTMTGGTNQQRGHMTFAPHNLSRRQSMQCESALSRHRSRFLQKRQGLVSIHTPPVLPPTADFQLVALTLSLLPP